MTTRPQPPAARPRRRWRTRVELPGMQVEHPSSDVALEPSLIAELPMAVNPGVYTVRVYGFWDAGDIMCAFQVQVDGSRSFISLGSGLAIGMMFIVSAFLLIVLRRGRHSRQASTMGKERR